MVVSLASLIVSSLDFCWVRQTRVHAELSHDFAQFKVALGESIRQLLLGGNTPEADRALDELARAGRFPRPNIFELVPTAAIKLLLGPSNKEQELYEQTLDIMREVREKIAPITYSMP